MNQFKLIDINTIIDATSFAESDNTAELEDELAKRKKNRYLRADFFVAVFLVIFLVFTVFGFHGVRQALYEEQSANLLRIMEKSSQNIDTMLLDKWEDVDFLARNLLDSSYESREDFLNKLSMIQNNMNESNGSIVVIDSSGICYTANGESFRWTNNAFLNKRERAVLVTDFPTMSMMFTARLPRSIQAGNLDITHVVMVTDMRSLDQFLMLKDYGTESATYIVHATGGHVYRQDATNDLSNMYNVVATLEQCEFKYGSSIEKMKKDLASDASGSAYAVIKDTPCYVVYERLSINDWYAIMIVPADLVGGNTTSFMRYIMIFMALFALGVMAIILSYLIINQRRRREQDEQIKAALKRTAVTMKKAAEAEKSANEAKTRFLSSMSHDIRTPMNAIIGLTMLAGKHTDDPVYVKDCLRKITVSGDYLLTLVNDILDISKVESGKFTLNPAVFSLAEVASNLVNIIRPQLTAKEQEFDVHIHKIQYEHLVGDELRINQIFLNLLTNAVKYTPEGGKIVVDLREEPVTEQTVRLIFSVEDNGIGMSEEFQKDMYSTFSRAVDSRTNEIQGTGLGLVICKQMVDLMEGTIQCKSTENVGTTFTVTLELQKAEESEDALTLPDLQLLLVDDDEIFLESAGQTLTEMGAEVDLAKDGFSAVEMMRKKHQAGEEYSMIIVDWKMPGLDGMDTVREIRALVGNQIPVLLVSAYDWSQIEQEVLGSGVDGFLSKPFFRSTVHHEIMHYLKEENTAQHKQLTSDKDLAGTRLLIAEDIELNFEIISDMLALHDIETVQAENGQICVDTINAAPEGSFDMILMDVQMPVLNGLEATQAIRRSEREWVRTIPIIAMTADAFAEDVQACLAAGMDSHLAKPVDLRKLIQELRRFRGTRHRK